MNDMMKDVLSKVTFDVSADEIAEQIIKNYKEKTGKNFDEKALKELSKAFDNWEAPEHIKKTKSVMKKVKKLSSKNESIVEKMRSHAGIIED